MRTIGNQGTKPTSYPLAASGFEGPKMAGLSSGRFTERQGACITERGVYAAPPRPQPQSCSSRVWVSRAAERALPLLLRLLLAHSHAVTLAVPRSGLPTWA